MKATEAKLPGFQCDSGSSISPTLSHSFLELNLLQLIETRALHCHLERGGIDLLPRDLLVILLSGRRHPASPPGVGDFRGDTASRLTQAHISVSLILHGSLQFSSCCNTYSIYHDLFSYYWSFPIHALGIIKISLEKLSFLVRATKPYKPRYTQGHTLCAGSITSLDIHGTLDGVFALHSIGGSGVEKTTETNVAIKSSKTAVHASLPW